MAWPKSASENEELVLTDQLRSHSFDHTAASFEVLLSVHRHPHISMPEHSHLIGRRRLRILPQPRRMRMAKHVPPEPEHPQLYSDRLELVGNIVRVHRAPRSRSEHRS